MLRHLGRTGTAAYLALLVVVSLPVAVILSGPSRVFAQRPDEGPVSQLLRDAFFTNTIGMAGTYRRPEELGPRMRHFDLKRDAKVIFVTVFNPNHSAKVRGVLIRPNGDQHGAFSYDLTALLGDRTWRSKSWLWPVSGLM